MPGFQTERPAPRGEMIGLRVTPEQNAMLAQIAERLNKSKSEILRVSLDYWLANAPDAAVAAAPPKKRRG